MSRRRGRWSSRAWEAGLEMPTEDVLGGSSPDTHPFSLLNPQRSSPQFAPTLPLFPSPSSKVTTISLPPTSDAAYPSPLCLPLSPSLSLPSVFLKSNHNNNNRARGRPEAALKDTEPCFLLAELARTSLAPRSAFDAMPLFLCPSPPPLPAWVAGWCWGERGFFCLRSPSGAGLFAF